MGRPFAFWHGPLGTVLTFRIYSNLRQSDIARRVVGG